MSGRDTTPGRPDAPGHWIDDPAHGRFLADDARAQLDFFAASVRSDGGIAALDFDGRPRPDAPQELHAVARLVHSYALGQIAGHPGAARIVDAALAALRSHHRDGAHGGYVQSVRDGAVLDGVKMAYGHAFVLLAAATASIAGHEDGPALLSDVAAIIDARFWDEARGLMREEYHADWREMSRYRGMNANMHSVEAMLAAFEATGQEEWLSRAERILDFFVGKIAPAHDWRLPEHYTHDWQVDPDYQGDPMFRPAGTTPGHSFELGRLLIQHWDLSGRRDPAVPSVARRLIETALTDAWRPDGGFVYTLSHGGTVRVAERYWWPATEAIGALATLIRLDPGPDDETWYRRVWSFSARHFVDHDRGGWFPQIDDDGSPAEGQFVGKPDIYHALQADLFPLSGTVSNSAASLRGCLDRL